MLNNNLKIIPQKCFTILGPRVEHAKQNIGDFCRLDHFGSQEKYSFTD